MTTPPPLAHHLVQAQALARPGALALTHGSRQLTFGALNERANQVARTLHERGVGAESMVALLLDRSPELLIAFLAVLKSGGTAVLLDPAHPRQRIERVIAATGTAVVVTLDRDRERVGATPTLLLDTDAATIVAHDAADLAVPIHPDHLAYIVNTSGSTGEPKRVAVTHRSVAHSIGTHQAGHRITAADRGSWLAPPGSSAAVGELWPFLAAGASVHVADPGIVANAEDLRDWLVRSEITKTFLSMPLAELMIDLDWPADCRLELVTIGSDTVRRWASPRLPFEVAVSCGSSEVNGLTSGLVPWAERLTSRTATAADRAGLPPIGRPWPDVHIHLLDEALRPVPAGAIGEIYVDSPELARGYLGAAALTADRFGPNPFGAPGSRLYRTGDLGRWRGDGHLEHHGRTDREVKIRGFRVAPAEIEAELLKLPYVRDAAVVAVGADGARTLAAYVIAAPRPAAEELTDYLAARLPAPMVPAVFTFLDRLPLTPNGKVDRNALPAPLLAPACGDGVPARDELERRIVDAFGSVLGRDGVGVNDNFFHLGGDSLAGSRLAGQLRRSLGGRVPLRTIFQHPTPSGLAEHLRREMPELVAALSPVPALAARVGEA